MNINVYWFFAIILFSMLVGFLLCFLYFLRAIKKATGVKSWKEFINQTKQVQELQKKMEKEGIIGIMNDPKIRKQMEELRKRFKKPKN